MPPKGKRPAILMDVLEKPKSIPKSKRKLADTLEDKLEQHTSFDVLGESTHMYLSPAPSKPLPEPLPEHHDNAAFNILTEEEIEHGNDESRQYELAGLGHLSIDMSSMSIESAAGETVIDPARKRKRTNADNPLLQWVPHIDQYLEEMLRHEGMGDSLDVPQCETDGCTNKHSIRCRDCHDTRMFCDACILTQHKALPYHRILVWNGCFFERTSLKNIGLRIQLGHPPGDICLAPEGAFNDDFTVLHTNGIHQVSLQFCGCQRALRPTVQLLRARLFPSTTIEPRTAATFELLEEFQMLSFTSKANAFDFYAALEARTDNTGTVTLPDRYHVFLRIIREWRHLRLLKRMGRGHSSSGAGGTKEGECALLCPACPLPGINLPDNWQECPDSERWLYAQFIGLDANFRLKRFNVSNNHRDPGLNHGYAYIVEETKFKQYLSEYDKKISEEKSTCNDHDAIKLAQQRGKAGTAANGSGTAECARHDMKRPNGVGDLQKGERYVNMDYFFFKSLKFNTPTSLVVSYDIGCQWSRNLMKRANTYPDNPLSSGKITDIKYLVPKFHLPAHVNKCQVNYSFNLLPGVGRCEGEAPERGWDDINAAAASTVEMGPGSRRDTLDDMFGARNWRKIKKIATLYLNKVASALAGREEHVAAFYEFDAALTIKIDEKDGGFKIPLDEWTEWCQSWEKSPNGKIANPFEATQTRISDKEVRLRLAEKDALSIKMGIKTLVHEGTSPSVLIYQGLEIEDLQRKLETDSASLGTHSTDLQRAKILERSNALRRKIDTWTQIQQLYIPELAIIRSRANTAGGGSLAVQDIKLYLPSDLPSNIGCEQDLIEAEWELRYATADVTLSILRSHLILRSRLYISKNLHSRGQYQNTRSNDVIHAVHNQIKATVAKYRHIRIAMLSLSRRRTDSESRSWEKIYLELEDADVKGLSSTDDHGAEGHKTLSWIWRLQGTGEAGVDGGTQEALRIEWCRARARAHRWQEECLLLNEEMRRVIAYFQWRAAWWWKLAEDPPMIGDQGLPRGTDNLEELNSNRGTIEGKKSYALRQASIQQQLEAACVVQWEGLSQKLMSMDGRDPRIMVEHGSN